MDPFGAEFKSSFYKEEFIIDWTADPNLIIWLIIFID